MRIAICDSAFALRLVCLASLLAVDARAAVEGGPVTNPANGHTYYLLSRTNWPSAEAEAVRMGGHLVAINDDAENAWVLDTFGNFAGTPRSLFIGLTDEGHEGNWVWTSGEPADYRNWAPGEPNNGYVGWPLFPYENCSMMYGAANPSFAGTWNDIIGTHPEQLYWGVVETDSQLSIRVSQVELCWPSINGVVYQMQYSASLSASSWTNLGPPFVGTGSRICLTDAVPVTGSRFYRLTSLP